MEINRELLEQFTDALTEMTRNSFVSDKPDTRIVITVYCNSCEEFHMYAFSPEEILDTSNPLITSIGMLLSGIEVAFIKACRDIGAKIASNNKEIVVVALVGSGGTIEITDEDMANKLGRLGEEEVMSIADRIVSGEIDESKFIAKKTIFVNAYAPPDVYYSVSYDVELVGGNDVLLVNREEERDKGSGNMFEIHEAFGKSSRMIRNIRAAIEPCDSLEDAMSEDNQKKFRLLINRIEAASNIEELVV